MCGVVALVHTVQPYFHSRPQRPRSLWSARRITTCRKVQHPKSAIHGLPVTLRMLRVKSDKSDWLRVRNDFSARVQKIGPGQRSRLLALTKSSADSGDENAVFCDGAMYHTVLDSAFPKRKLNSPRDVQGS